MFIGGSGIFITLKCNQLLTFITDTEEVPSSLFLLTVYRVYSHISFIVYTETDKDQKSFVDFGGKDGKVDIDMQSPKLPKKIFVTFKGDNLLISKKKNPDEEQDLKFKVPLPDKFKKPKDRRLPFVSRKGCEGNIRLFFSLEISMKSSSSFSYAISFSFYFLMLKTDH